MAEFNRAVAVLMEDQNRRLDLEAAAQRELILVGRRTVVWRRNLCEPCGAFERALFMPSAGWVCMGCERAIEHDPPPAVSNDPSLGADHAKLIDILIREFNAPLPFKGDEGAPA